MAIQFSILARNAFLDALETYTGTSAVLKIRTGAAPANCDAEDAGTVLSSMTLPSDWMESASNGSKVKSGTWEDASADASGTAEHWRLYQSDGTTCVAQGTITITGGGGDMTLVNTNIATGQPITITSFTLTAPGA